MQKLLVAVTLLLSVAGASADHGKQIGEPMVVTVKKLIAEGQLVIDVRQEACDGYVTGAQLISIDDFSSAPDITLGKVLKLVNNDKSKPINVYCKSGVRSGRAIGVLKQNGFTNLHNLGGVGEYYDSATMQKCE